MKGKSSRARIRVEPSNIRVNGEEAEKTTTSADTLVVDTLVVDTLVADTLVKPKSTNMFVHPKAGDIAQQRRIIIENAISCSRGKLALRTNNSGKKLIKAHP